VITAQAQGARIDLGWQMPVADLPGKRQKMPCITTGDLHQGFRFRHDLDDPAIVENKPVSMAQTPRLRQIEHKRNAVVADHAPAAAMARRFIERDGAGWIAKPAGDSSRQDAHGNNPFRHSCLSCA